MSTRAPEQEPLLAWSLWLVTFGCCAAGLLVALVVTRPLTLAVLVEGARFALAFPLRVRHRRAGLALRRPDNPIGWLYAASGLVWSLLIPLDPWVDQLIHSGRPLPLAAQFAAVAGEFHCAPAITLGITLPFLLLPNGRLRSAAGEWSRRRRDRRGPDHHGRHPDAGQTAETSLPIANPFRPGRDGGHDRHPAHQPRRGAEHHQLPGRTAVCGAGVPGLLVAWSARGR